MFRQVFAVILFASLVSSISNWDTHQHDLENTGSTPESGPENFNILGEFGRWNPSYECYTGSAPPDHAPLLHNGRLYMYTSHPVQVFAICVYQYDDPVNGFMGQIGCDVQSTPIVVGDTLFTHCGFDPGFPPHNQIKAWDVETLSLKWKRNLPLFGWYNSMNGMTYGANKIFIGYAGNGGAQLPTLWALNASSTNPFGQEVWKITFPDHFGKIYRAPLFLNESLYVSYGNQSGFFLIKLNANTSDEIWTRKVGSEPGFVSPIHHGGTIYTAGNSLRAYDEDGNEKWARGVYGTAYGLTYWKDQIIYFGLPQTNWGRMHAINATNGSLIWQYDYPVTGGYARGTPAVSENGIIYHCGGPNFFVAINATDGTKLWHSALGCRDQSPSVYRGITYVPTRSSDSNGWTLAIGPEFPPNEPPMVTVTGPGWALMGNEFNVTGDAVDSDGIISNHSWTYDPSFCNLNLETSNGMGTSHFTSIATFVCYAVGPQVFEMGVFDNAGTMQNDQDTVEILDVAPVLGNFDIIPDPILYWADGILRGQTFSVANCKDGSGDPIDCGYFSDPAWNLQGFEDDGITQIVEFADFSQTYLAVDTASIDQSGNFWVESAVPGDGQILAEIDGIERSVDIVVSEYSLTVIPSIIELVYGGVQDFDAECESQNVVISCPQAPVWSLENGLFGTIDANTGVYTAPLFPSSGQVHATIGTVYGTADVSVWENIVPTSSSEPIPDIVEPNMLYLNCPRLVQRDETLIEVQCWREGVPCDLSDISLNGAPYQFVGTGHGSISYSVETLQAGTYYLTAQVSGLDTSSCSIQRANLQPASVPELHPALILFLAASMLFVMRRRA
ncbi:PQQ-binding-like beta-propeller repeat protein [Candidatus Micrarchaeota archaeon]|nr:PQQ-binding-like beta-propeller repeat protein [Candidatus Micrarchaeota archaeon]